MGGSKINQAFEVNEDHLIWLKDMAIKYDLTDESKVLRILMDYAIADGDPEDIFETIRCHRCG